MWKDFLADVEERGLVSNLEDTEEKDNITRILSLPAEGSS